MTAPNAAEVRALYAEGDSVGAWSSLLAWGEGLRASPEMLATARDIAEETMRRARGDVEQIVERLRARGYLFLDPERAIQPPLEGASARLDALEQEIGPIPCSIRALYTTFGACNLMGQDPTWPNPACVELPGTQERSNQAVWYTDPLVVMPLDQVLDELADSEQEDEHWIVVSGDVVRKAGFSGGRYGVRAPNAAADAPLEGTDGGLDLVTYLRNSISEGGLPGLRTLPGAPQDYVSALTAGLVGI